MRTQYAHIIDMVPTVLDLLGLEPPATIRGVTQAPLQGVSFAHTLDDARRAEQPHHTQYFEMLGHRAIYHDGWRAVCPWPGPSFTEAGVGFGQPISAEKLSELDAKGWELYHVDEDFAENHNVAAENRDKLIALIATWYVEAGKYDVHADRRQRSGAHDRREAAGGPAARALHLPARHAVGAVLRRAAPLNRPHSITASVEIPEDGAEGVLLCQGSAAGGYSLYIKDGKLHYVHNYVGRALYGVDVRGGRAGRQARPALRVRAHRQARPARTARAHPAACSSTSTAPWSPTRRRRTTTPFILNPGALSCGANPGLAGHAGLPEPVQVHRHAP